MAGRLPEGNGRLASLRGIMGPRLERGPQSPASTGIWGSLSEASGDPKAAQREGQAAEPSVVPVGLERRHGG